MTATPSTDDLPHRILAVVQAEPGISLKQLRERAFSPEIALVLALNDLRARRLIENCASGKYRLVQSGATAAPAPAPVNMAGRSTRARVLYLAALGIAITAYIMIWLSVGNRSAPLVMAPSPAPAVQTAPDMPADPWADEG